MHDETTKALEAQRAEHGQRLDAVLAQASTKRAAMEAAYTAAIPLHAATEYWRQKEEGHRRSARWRGGVSLVMGGAFLGVLIWIAWGMHALDVAVPSLKVEGSDPPEQVASPMVLDAVVRRISILALLLTAGIWLVRLLVRSYQSERHLMVDARERKVMIATYLALVADGKLSDEASRAELLRAIFRNASSGLLRDEAPPYLHDAIRNRA